LYKNQEVILNQKIDDLISEKENLLKNYNIERSKRDELLNKFKELTDEYKEVKSSFRECEHQIEILKRNNNGQAVNTSSQSKTKSPSSGNLFNPRRQRKHRESESCVQQ
jgi:uncharacterized coiled-coil DUF342 family protein